MDARFLPRRCYRFESVQGTRGFIIAEVMESSAFQYGNRTSTKLTTVAEFGGRFAATSRGLDTRYVDVTTNDGLDEAMRGWAEEHYGELTAFEADGISSL